MKYIVVRSGGVEYPLLFPGIMRHRAQVPKGMERAVVSAGHVRLLTTDENPDSGHVASHPERAHLKVHAFGGSGTLGLDSRPEDAGIILSSLTARTR